MVSIHSLFLENQNNEGIHIILIPIVGLFVNISKSLNYENYNIFLSKVANLSDLDLDPFFDVYDYLKVKNILKEDDAITLEYYGEFINKLSGLIKKKSDRKMSVIYNILFSWTNGKRQQKMMIYVFYATQILKTAYYYPVNTVKN